MSQIEVGVCKELEVSKIRPSKFNAREQKEAIDSDEFKELCESIKADGLIEPIIVRKVDNDGLYEAIAGTRRLRAIKHLGLKEAPAVLRKMNDNDVRIASLVENIHRKGLENDDKKRQIKEIYKGEGFEDFELVKKYLDSLYRREHGQLKRASFEKHGPSLIDIPEGFREVAKRIGYSFSYQADILDGVYSRVPKDHQDPLTGLHDEQRKIVESNPVLKKHPRIQQHVAHKSKKKTPAKVKQIVDQTVHDIKTGAIEEDKDTENITFHPSKHENITKPDTEMNPAAARDEIIKACEELYRLITGIKLDMSDPSKAEKQVTTSQQVRNNIREICTYELQKRDKRALQDAVLPTLKALDKLADEIESSEK